MTEIIPDTINEAKIIIDGEEWQVGESVVELTQAGTPNYVDINTMVPETDTNVPSPPSDLIDEPFELIVDNQLISERDTDADEERTLFKGNVANISPTGQRSYEAIAYDPSQQGFNGTDGGSVMNQKITIKRPAYNSIVFKGENYGGGVQYKDRSIKAKQVALEIVEFLDLDDYDIQITDGGVSRSGEGGEEIGAKNVPMYFSENKVKVKEALERVAEASDSVYWFDKEGTFHIGVPDSTKHLLHYITDASDGYTTPPYQSVRIIGSGIKSQEGFARANMEPEERISETYEIGKEFTEDEDSGSSSSFVPVAVDEPSEPVFEYRNSELTSQDQIENAAKKITKDLGKQQAEGKVTVVGFPEVEIFDAVKMPQAEDEDKENYHPKQPMGGSAYQVYKVVHKLNGTDGFKTEIHVAGLVGSSRTAVEDTSQSSGESGSNDSPDNPMQATGSGDGGSDSGSDDSGGFLANLFG